MLNRLLRVSILATMVAVLGFARSLNPVATAQGPQQTQIWYVTSHSGDNLARYSSSGAFVQDLVPAGSGGLKEARGFVFLGANLLLASANEANSQILQYNAITGAFIGVWASSNGLDHPYSVAVSPHNGNLYITSQDNNTVSAFSGAAPNTPLGVFIPPDSSHDGGLSEPRQGIFGPDGHFYLASRGTDAILRYHGQTGKFIDAFVKSKAGGLDKPIQLAFGPDGHLYVGSSGNNKVLRYHGQTGKYLNDFVDGNKPSGGGLQGPSGIAFGPLDGDLYVGSRLTGQVLRYKGSDGTFLGVFIDKKSGGLNEPEFILPVLTPVAPSPSPTPSSTPSPKAPPGTPAPTPSAPPLPSPKSPGPTPGASPTPPAPAPTKPPPLTGRLLPAQT